METNEFESRYKGSDKTIMLSALEARNTKNNRIDEIISFAKNANFKKIGIANCATFEKEASELHSILSNKGFEVHSINCKTGKIPNETVIEGRKGISCNPFGQAEYLEENKTDFNISMGLCVGHDMLFNSKSKVPVTTLIVKDNLTDNHTVELLQNNP